MSIMIKITIIIMNLNLHLIDMQIMTITRAVEMINIILYKDKIMIISL